MLIQPSCRSLATPIVQPEKNSEKKKIASTDVFWTLFLLKIHIILLLYMLYVVLKEAVFSITVLV